MPQRKIGMVPKVWRQAPALAAQNELHNVKSFLAYQRLEVAAHTLTPEVRLKPPRINRLSEQSAQRLLRNEFAPPRPQTCGRRHFEHLLSRVKAAGVKLESLLDQRAAL